PWTCPCPWDGWRFFNEPNNLMTERNDGPRAGTTSRLYREFAEFYDEEWCRWAPDNPRRGFNLAFEKVYPKFSDRLTEEEFIAVMYSTLGFHGSKPPGLFETFDPGRYGCRLPLDDHFVNLFKARLEWRVRDRLRKEVRRRRKRERPHDRAVE